MPKNTRGGKKAKRGKNQAPINTKKPLELATDGQVYGKVKKRLGGSYVQVECSDDKIRKGYIRGKYKKRVWFNKDDIVLCSLGMNQKEDVCELSYKYRPHEIAMLRAKGEINFGIIDSDNTGYEFTDQVDIPEQKIKYDQGNDYNVIPDAFDDMDSLDDSDDSDDSNDSDNFDNKKNDNSSPDSIDLDDL